MLNEVTLTTTVCFAIVAFMALIYGEMRLLQKTAKQRQGMSLVATLEKPGAVSQRNKASTHIHQICSWS